YEMERAELLRRLEELRSRPAAAPAADLPAKRTVRVEAFSCNSCGAPVAVAPAARVATCSRCGARPRIQRSARALYTPPLQRALHRSRGAGRAPRAGDGPADGANRGSGRTRRACDALEAGPGALPDP